MLSTSGFTIPPLSLQPPPPPALIAGARNIKPATCQTSVKESPDQQSSVHDPCPLGQTLAEVSAPHQQSSVLFLSPLESVLEQHHPDLDKDSTSTMAEYRAAAHVACQIYRAKFLMDQAAESEQGGDCAGRTVYKR